MEAFEQLVRKYQSPLITAAYHLLHHVEDAQDLTQEALLEAYRRLRQLRDREIFRPWLFTILRHKCLRHLQHCRPCERFEKEYHRPELVRKALAGGE